LQLLRGTDLRPMAQPACRVVRIQISN
jgi:hypothetical protein